MSLLRVFSLALLISVSCKRFPATRVRKRVRRHQRRREHASRAEHIITGVRVQVSTTAMHATVAACVTWAVLPSQPGHFRILSE